MPFSVRALITAILIAAAPLGVALGPSAPVAHGQQTSALINEALDKLVKFDLSSSLPEAMKKIAQETGVRLEAAPAVWELLPYGRQTNITAKLENVTLREALGAITRELGLQFVLRDEAVEIQPMPALSRLGRRATLEELGVLRVLSATPLEAPTDAKGVAYADLTQRVADRLGRLAPPVTVDERTRGDSALAQQNVGVARSGSLLDALEAISNQTTATWYPWGRGVVILKKVELVSNLLSKPVSLRYAGEDVTQVLHDLSQLAGMPFTFRPGSIQLIPAEFRKIRLVVDNAPLKQALEAISAFTGLGYSYDERGVYFWNQTYGIDAGQRDPAMLMVQLDNGVMMLVPRSQLPEDVRQYLQQKGDDAIGAIREKMKKDGFVPATQPGDRDL